MSSQEEKIAWLKEHLHYELLMLRYTLDRMRNVKTPLDWNAFYESWAVHARILYAFLTNGDGANRKANEYTAFQAKKTNETISTFQKLGSQVLHAGKDRAYEAQQKANIENAGEISRWVETEFAAFLEALETTTYAKHWTPDQADPTKVLNVAVSAVRGASSQPTTTTLASAVTGDVLWKRSS